MADARIYIKRLLPQNGPMLFPFLAFAIPLMVRAVPEFLMVPYLVGFDGIGYYVPNTLGWLDQGVDLQNFFSSAPLIYVLLLGITSTGASIVIFLKILAPFLLAVLSLAIYFYARKALSWSPAKSLLVALLATLYFVALRISWDMYRTELALAFLFIALIILGQKKLTRRNALLLSITMMLVAFTHQLVTVIMFSIIIATVIHSFYKGQKAGLLRIALCSVPAALLFFSIIYINYFVYSSPIAGYSGNFSAGFETIALSSHFELVIDTVGFLVFCYLPLLPLLILSLRRFKGNIQLKAWIVWAIIPILLAILIPNTFFLGGVLPYRWTLLLFFPLAFYAADGLCALKRSWLKIIAAAIVLLLAFLSVSFIVLPNNEASSYYGSYVSYVPKSMLQNTIQLSDCQDTTNALLWAHNNLPGNGYLLAHEAFYGWAVLQVNNTQLIPYFFGDPAIVASQMQQTNPTNPLFLVWWVNGTGWYGQSTLPDSFQELYRSGNIAIYEYSSS